MGAGGLPIGFVRPSWFVFSTINYKIKFMSYLRAWCWPQLIGGPLMPSGPSGPGGIWVCQVIAHRSCPLG
jgi:hypothetical protein